MIPCHSPAGLHGNPGRKEIPFSNHGNAKQEPDEPQIEVDWFVQKINSSSFNISVINVITWQV